MPSTEPDRLREEHELAEYLHVPLPTVQRWRREGSGPRFIRIGRSVRYRPEDIEHWLERHAAPRGVLS
jgi:excisionase family DNA binding protein